jgi:large subunit ribosomal protein L29
LRVDEIRALNEEELNKQLGSARKELFDLRFRRATKQLVNHREVRRVKKEIARLETIKRERELGTA